MTSNQKSIFKELFKQPYKKTPANLYDYAKDNINFVQRFGLIKTLPLHQGCVNTLSWNESGSLLLSGSDDQHLVVTNGHTYKVVSDYRTSHRANIFSAKFMPASGDHNIVSCSGDGIVLYTDLERPSETYYSQFNCHSGTSYEVITIPNDPNTFFSCGEDGTVRWFDLRLKSRCKKVRCKDDILILHHRAVTALSINPIMPHELAIGSSDSTVRTFDRRMLGTIATGYTKNPVHEPLTSFTVPELEERTYRITSLSYSPDGQEMLVSYSSDHLYLFRVRDQNEREVIVEKDGPKSNWAKLKNATKRARRSPPPVRRLRLRGDWSDTGPDARPERDTANTVSIGQARPQLQATLMERMTNVLFRMLNDPLTRAALSAGGEDSLETNSSSAHSHENTLENNAHPEESMEQHDTSAEERNETNEQSQEMETESQDNITPAAPQQSPAPDSNPANSIEIPGNEASGSNAQIKSCDTQDHMVNQLHDKLSTLRHGFIEKHGSEPSVSLRYSDQSSSSSTIRLGVSNELDRSSYGLNSGGHSSQSNQGSQNQENTPSTSRTTEHETSSQSSEANVNSSNSSTSVNQAETASTSCDKAHQVQTKDNNNSNNSVHHDMDCSSIEDMIVEEPSRESQLNAEPSGSDVELDYTDSEEEHADSMKNNIGDGCDEVNAISFEPHVKQKYVGHRNARTMIKEATFWGNDYVMSGSDCGHVFIWDRKTAKLVMLLQADHHVVNCLQPHPTLPILATSGIDHDVKLWSPILEDANFDLKMAEDLMKRNEVMLEETRDTITVPAAFMIRMLACLNQIRRTGSLSRRRRDDSDPDA